MWTGFLVEKNDSGAGRVWALQHFHFNDMVNATCNRYQALGNGFRRNGA
jgi:hypothetical protein